MRYFKSDCGTLYSIVSREEGFIYIRGKWNKVQPPIRPADDMAKLKDIKEMTEGEVMLELL